MAVVHLHIDGEEARKQSDQEEVCNSLVPVLTLGFP